MKQTRDELEFAISQYIDGALPPVETAALEERLASDAEARQILAEYRALDAQLKSQFSLPDIAWDRFEQHLIESTAGEEAPIRHYQLATWGRLAAVAVAALLTVVSGVIYFANFSQRQGTDHTTTAGKIERGDAIVVVVGPQAEQPQNSVSIVANVEIGPAPTWSESWRYAESVVSRPAVVLIDRAATPAHDIEPLLY